jgi:hypothetical protein
MLEWIKHVIYKCVWANPNICDGSDNLERRRLGAGKTQSIDSLVYKNVNLKKEEEQYCSKNCLLSSRLITCVS